MNDFQFPFSRVKEWLAFIAVWLCLQIWLERLTSLGDSKHEKLAT